MMSPDTLISLLIAIALLVVLLRFADFLARPADEDRFLIGHSLPMPGEDHHVAKPIRIAAKNRLRHVYVIGGTGSGKTNLLLRMIRDDIAARRSVVVLDLRGDLVDRILRLLAAGENPDLADRLVLLDLRDDGHVLPVNPLIGPGEPFARALHVLSVIRKQSESWGVQLEETLRNTLLALAETGWSLLEVEPMLTSAAFREEVLGGVSDPYVVSFFERYGELPEEKQVTWRLPVLNKVTPLLSVAPLRRTFGSRESLAFGELFDEGPGAIFLASLAVDRLHEAAYLAGGLLVSSLQTAMMARTAIPEDERVPVMLYVDEFETMATERFEAIVAEGRRFGLGLTLSHQNLTQVPATLRSVLRNNVRTQVYFSTGAVDASELSGDVVAVAKREEIKRALMTQRVGEAFVVRRGRETVRAATPLYREAPVSREKVEAVRAAGYARFAVTAEALDAELTARREAHGGTRATCGKSLEVRYAKPARGLSQAP